MIFVDTSAWLALADANDRDHRLALEFQRHIVRGEFGRQVTTNYVMAETVTMVRQSSGGCAGNRVRECRSLGQAVRPFLG